MNTKEYYIKQISRTNKKNYENYVVCRILNLLNDQTIKFVTQQPVRTGRGRRFLTDLYFPQIDLHIEVDEEHHKNQKEDDIKREADIVDVTWHKIERIDVSGDLSSIHKEIDRIIKKIKQKVQEKKGSGQFMPWDINEEFNSNFYIQRGYIDLKDKVALRKIVDVCNCFGCNYKGYQRAVALHPKEKDAVIWTPKLYENNEWDNQIINGGKTIIERSKTRDEEYTKWAIPKSKKMIVFAHAKDSLGITLYRFKGVFRLDDAKSKGNKAVYKRIGTRVNAYK